MSNLLEQFRVAAFVRMQSQGSMVKGLFATIRLLKRDWHALLAVGFFEVSLAGIRRNLKQIIVFPG